MTYGIRLKVWGDYACFTRPEMKVERVSYDVMTPSAARGILEAIHWKPTIRWVVVTPLVRWMSARGILAGTPQTAALPALYAATSPDAAGRRLYGPNGLGHLSGAPAEQPLYRTLRRPDDAARVWTVSEELTEVAFAAGP